MTSQAAASDTEPMRWEEAVALLRSQPENRELVKACYFDDPLAGAAKRFHASPEWQAAQKLFGPGGGQALDLGAGRGVAAYALAKDGFAVTALEPDPSALVGAAAIRALVAETGVVIEVVERWGEALPFADASFDVVHARQVLHHARDLDALAREVVRVLKPGGRLLATREHVVDSPEDLRAFLDAHPLHRLYGGENAYTLDRYLGALRGAGLRLKRVYSPWESDLNRFPETLGEIKKRLAGEIGFPFPRLLPDAYVHHRSRRLTAPGRLYSFWGVKP